MVRKDKRAHRSINRLSQSLLRLPQQLLQNVSRDLLWGPSGLPDSQHTSFGQNLGLGNGYPFKRLMMTTEKRPFGGRCRLAADLEGHHKPTPPFADGLRSNETCCSSSWIWVYCRPSRRLTDEKVFRGLRTACRLAACPTKTVSCTRVGAKKCITFNGNALNHVKGINLDDTSRSIF